MCMLDKLIYFFAAFGLLTAITLFSWTICEVGEYIIKERRNNRD